jgi:hypothetical protein
MHVLPPPPRRALAGALGLLLALGACRTPQPTPADWRATGFRTPEQAFRTFRTAFATDQLDLEYRCLSTGMKQRRGIDSLGYRLLRDQLQREVRGFRSLAAAQVQGLVPLGPERVGLVARIEVLWIERYLWVELVREDFFEVYRDGVRWRDGYLEPFEQALTLDESDQPPLLWVAVPLVTAFGSPEPLDLAQVSEVVVGREWKIDELAPLDEEQARARLAAVSPLVP